ncbi:MULTISPECIES: hypothetical protein [Priestia]|uniref:hypothetical protein n=1 Tax=Priestia TaxID=2800373 RepID=UPI000BF04A71|nr:MULTISPECIES: hypothetical protein [Priestia]NLR46353.1 hypothetical protein [Priestia megaterium]PEI54667.1 hypothetical protein CN635_20425 [Priestia aryabhattai]WDC91186.1 hypothetical protein PSR56_27740 [Priestia megaterium]
MKKIMIIACSSIIFIVLITFIVFVNWQHIFGANRPIANAKAIYQLEFKDKGIAETSNVDNDILYIVPKGHLDTYIKTMNKKGYKLSEKDIDHNRLVFQKGNNFTEISYKRFARKYTMIESPFLKEI